MGLDKPCCISTCPAKCCFLSLTSLSTTVCLIMFNATFNNISVISWRLRLLVNIGIYEMCSILMFQALFRYYVP